MIETLNTVADLEGILDDTGNDVSFAVRRSGRLIECVARGRGSYRCQ